MTQRLTFNERKVATEMYVTGRKSARYICFRLHVPLAAVEELIATLTRPPNVTEARAADRKARSKRKGHKHVG